MDNLDFLFTSHDSICAIANTSCRTWLSETDKLEKAISHCKEKSFLALQDWSLWPTELFSWPWLDIQVVGSEASQMNF